MTQEIQWGPAIAVDGKRPEWLERHTPLRWYGHGMTQEWWDRGGGDDFTTADRLFWADNITSIRLPADHPHYRQTEVAPINWSGELEAAHEDGRTIAMKVAQLNAGAYGRNDHWLATADGSRFPGGPGSTHSEWAHKDGDLPNTPGWRIRNVPQPTPQADTKPDLTAEQRAVELARSMALSNGAQSVALEHFFREARAIVALLPELNVAQPFTVPRAPCMTISEVREMVAKGEDAVIATMLERGYALPEPVDEDLIEARKLAAAWSESQDVSHSHYLDGYMDDSSEVRGMKAALARGRVLALAGEKEA